MEKKQSRKRLRPFLEHHCDQNSFPGLLYWLDKEEKIFAIVWKHQGKRCKNSSDSVVFKAWALASGKYNEGEPEDTPLWKTRLRTALTKLTDIEEMKSMHNLHDPDNPYKAYKILDGTTIATSKGGQQGSPFSESGYSCSSSSPFQPSPDSQKDNLINSDSENDGDDHRDLYAMPLNIPTVVNEKINSMETNISEDLLNLSPNACKIHPDSVSNATNIQYNINVQQNYLEQDIAQQQFEEHGKIPSDLEQIDSDNLVHMNSDTTEQISRGSSLPSIDSMSSMPKSELQIKVYFMDHFIFEDTIDDKARLYCGDISQQCQVDALAEDKKVFGPLNLKQILIKDIDEVKMPFSVTEIQKKKIRELQSNMLRGLLVGIDKSHIYAQRLCKTRVYAWTRDGKNQRLERESNNPVPVFNLETYKKQLQNYYENGDLPQPSPSVIFSFGQEYNVALEQLGRILVYVKVTHLQALKLLTYVENAKHDSSELQFSNSNSADALADIFKQFSIENNLNKM